MGKKCSVYDPDVMGLNCGHVEFQVQSSAVRLEPKLFVN